MTTLTNPRTSIRSNFMPDIWKSLEIATSPALFSYSELLVGLTVTLANGAAVLVVNNFREFQLALATCLIL
ncbi:MAG: DUF5690 family protein [Aureliella sp.]